MISESISAQNAGMRTVLLGLLVLSGCGPQAEAPMGEGPASGHFVVTAKADGLAALDPAAAWTVTVGGVAAYDVQRVDASTVRFTVQGHPDAGSQGIVVTARRVSVEAGTVKYAAPVDARFARLIAFGASLTMGSQDASISQRSQLHGPAAIIARQAGAYLGIPLIRPNTLPALTTADIDPVRCRPFVDDIFGTIGARAQNELLPKLKDSAGNVAIAKMRVDPALVATNVAIGGFRIAETVGGAKSFFGTILEHVIWDPKVDVAGLVNPPKEAQLQRVEALKPTIAISTDLIGNDYNNVNLHTDGIPDLAALTPVAEVKASLAELMTRLDATGAEVFVATGPDNTVLPDYAEKVARLKAAGVADLDATGWLAGIRARIAEYNDALLAEAKKHPKVHVVDLHRGVAAVLKDGVALRDGVLKPAPFGGLLSLDSMHFSDTGYAVLANMFIDQINADLGTRIPRADLDAIHATDAYSIEALRAAGLSCAGATN